MPGTICPNKVKAGGEFLQKKTGPTDEEASQALASAKENVGAYYYNNYLHTTFIKIFDNADDITVEVTFWIEHEEHLNLIFV